MKKEVGNIDAVPSKRLFLSIIADYDLNRSICELIDNVLDIWVRDGRSRPVEIDVELEENQQTICVSDNAGGVKKSELCFVVGPGQTSNLPTEETIGIFGVGTKRAVVALAQEVRIATRHGRGKTYLVEFDDSWLESEDWELPVYQVDELPQGTTVVTLQRLRVRITDGAISHLREHLQATYARFLQDRRVTIRLNSTELGPLNFENWAYPPRYPPHRYVGTMRTRDGASVDVEVRAGLTRESSPAGGEYGVYFYCNDRLIARGLKSYDVGFTRGLAGLPHPSISLTRVIVSLKGEARAMPWNSSKSGINPNSPLFAALRSWLVQVVKDYASLSRRYEGDWSGRVFKYSSGRMPTIRIDSFPDTRKSHLPPLPKSRLRYGDLVQQANRRIGKEKPWTRGLYESIIAVDLISKQSLEQKNRICLILLDSTLEIAFKEYLVNESGSKYGDARLRQLFQDRTRVQDEIKKYVRLKSALWKKINHYYPLRCKLVHERATVGIDDSQIEDFREVVQTVLKKLFRLTFDKE